MVLFSEIFETSTFWKILNYLNQFEKNTVLILFLLVLVGNNNLKIKFSSKISFLFTTTFISFYLIYNLTYYIYNEDLVTVSYNNNINLINGLLVIHPILMYTGYIRLWYFFKTKITKNTIKYMFFKKKTLISLIIVGLTMLLGSVWAQQELNWGGWWAWDPIELISFIVFIVFVWLNHIKNYTFNFFLFYNNRLTVNCYLFFFLVIVRYDVFNSVHSFLQSEFRDLEELLNTILSVCNVIFILFFLIYLFFFKNFTLQKIKTLQQRGLFFYNKDVSVTKRWFNFFNNFENFVVILLFFSMVWIFFLLFFFTKNKIEKDDYLLFLIQIKTFVFLTYVYLYTAKLKKNFFFFKIYMLLLLGSFFYQTIIYSCFFIIIFDFFNKVFFKKKILLLHMCIYILFIVVYTCACSNVLSFVRSKLIFLKSSYQDTFPGNLYFYKNSNVAMFDTTHNYYGNNQHVNKFNFTKNQLTENTDEFLKKILSDSRNSPLTFDFSFNSWFTQSIDLLDEKLITNNNSLEIYFFNDFGVESLINVLHSNIIHTKFSYINYSLETTNQINLIDNFNLIVFFGFLILSILVYLFKFFFKKGSYVRF